MRQFDVFVWDDNTDNFSEFSKKSPPFTDPALGWFFGNDLNSLIGEADAEWFVFAHNSIKVDRTFLNDLALAIEAFPMVDAFAPRIAEQGSFTSGYLLEKWSGLKMLPIDAPLRFVAAPSPYIAAFSRRIVQRTGGFDQSLPFPISIVDYAFRMLHAGGKMFSVPYFVATRSEAIIDIDKDPTSKQNNASLSFTLYKNFGFFKVIPYLLAHPRTIYALYKHRKVLEEKRNAAILLSKLTNKTLKEITCTVAKRPH